jgi:magnesium-transporting ATPase (P-type)
VQQSRGWVHYAVHRPEPHIMLFRRPLNYQQQQENQAQNMLVKWIIIITWVRMLYATILWVLVYVSCKHGLNLCGYGWICESWFVEQLLCNVSLGSNVIFCFLITYFSRHLVVV